MAVSKSSQSSELLGALRQFLEERIGSAELVCLGLSGGRDSVVLLHLLSRLDLGSRLSALHVHHGLSANADAWAGFCQRYCQMLGVRLTVEAVAVNGIRGQGLEAAARHARYAVFERSGADCLLLAHHRDDQAETVLFNLIRGSGVTGAAGMRHERCLGSLRVLRPLLGVGGVEIAAYAAEQGLTWVEDESNGDTNFSRNFIRLEVMPALENRFPAASACLASAARHFAEADHLLGELAEIDWQACAVGDKLAMRSLRQLSAERLKNLLRHRLRCLGWQAPDAARLNEFARQLLTAAPDKHPRLLLPEGEMLVARRHLNWLGKASAKMESGD